MTNYLQRLGISLLCLGLALSLIPPGVIDAAPQAQTQLVASLEVLAPGVEIQRAGTEQWLSAIGRSAVVAGDRIRTDEAGEAIVVWFEDGSLMSLKPDTEIEINAFEGSATDDDASFTIETTISFGRVFHGVERLIDAESRYQVNTPTLAAAVRGTVFGLEVNAEEETLMLVTEGVVAVSQGDQEHTVSAGFWLRATPDQPLAEPISIESVLDDPFIQDFVAEFDDFEDLRQGNDDNDDANRPSRDDNPGQGDDNPGQGDDNPGQGDDNPGQGGDNPGQGDDNPGQGDDNPGQGDDNPGQGGDNPGQGRGNNN